MTENSYLEESCAQYGFDIEAAKLLRHNENMTYRVSRDGQDYVMRIHKPVEGFHLDFLRMQMDKKQMITDEMQILEYLDHHTELGTQKVIRNRNGQPVTILSDGTPVTVLQWVSGVTLEEVSWTPELARQMGTMIGVLHRSLRKLQEQIKLLNQVEHQEQISLLRYHYDEVLLAQMLLECDRALEAGHFSEEQTKIIRDTLTYMKNFFQQNQEEKRLVHSDLSKSNLILHEGKIVPIDFSLSGFSIAEMDLASIFSHVNDDKLSYEICVGYQNSIGTEYEVSQKAIDVCFCFQILLFVICQHDKVAGEEWFPYKLDGWCREQFLPLVQKGSI